MTQKLPTFVRCADGKFYEDLVYQDHPARREWFICFDDKEPAELVIRASLAGGDMGPREILKARGFLDVPGALSAAVKPGCVLALLPGRRDPHKRFFGMDATGAPTEGHEAISYFLKFKRGVALPDPCEFDSCVEIYPFFPNKPGVYFGDKR